METLNLTSPTEINPFKAHRFQIYICTLWQSFISKESQWFTPAERCKDVVETGAPERRLCGILTTRCHKHFIKTSDNCVNTWNKGSNMIGAGSFLMGSSISILSPNPWLVCCSRYLGKPLSQKCQQQFKDKADCLSLCCLTVRLVHYSKQPFNIQTQQICSI